MTVTKYWEENVEIVKWMFTGCFVLGGGETVILDICGNCDET